MEKERVIWEPQNLDPGALFQGLRIRRGASVRGPSTHRASDARGECAV